MKYFITSMMLLLTGSSISMAIEEPSYKVLKSDGNIEIREYQSYVIAETFISTSVMDEASNAAFKKLFKYISGNNSSKSDIAMTAPVTTTRSEKIEMTAPVSTTRSADGYTVAFTLPMKYSLATSPIPTDTAIHIREVPSHTVAVIRFSGRWTETSMNEHEQELFQWMKSNGHVPIGIPVIARYDPPFMPWFMRRNEIQIEIAR
ncbi:MAG TPA: heme-binding protein [Bacteroidetes bacterium]|nr:heme-binding protein [Bacteroidota bacterium]